MQYDVRLKTVGPTLIAAVCVAVPAGEVSRRWKPALDQVWAFLRRHGEIERHHNLFLYHHPRHEGDAMTVDFGVQVMRPFEPEGEVRCVETPGGEVATTVHAGSYDQLSAAHKTLLAWCAAQQRTIGTASWEIYGDWNNDPTKLKTTICYLLQ